MNSIAPSGPTAQTLESRGVAYAHEIAAAARRHGLDPRLLAAVAAQETGGPGSNAGRNIVGDGGHGHGLFQIDDRWHAFGRSAAAMQPARNAEYAAGLISGLLHRYGGNLREALSAYNSGCPESEGTVTRWADGQSLGYADSVLRHYEDLAGAAGPSPSLPAELDAERAADCERVNALGSFAAGQAGFLPAAVSTRTYSYRELAGLDDDGASRRGGLAGGNAARE